MKIKQDRASRTYELQVWGGEGLQPHLRAACVCGGDSPDPHADPIPHGTPRTQQSPSGLIVFLPTCSPSPALLPGEAPRCRQGLEPDTPVALASPPLFPGLFSAPSLAMIHQSPTPPPPFDLCFYHLLLPPLLCHHSPTPTPGCFSPPVLTQRLQCLSPSHWSPRSSNNPPFQTPPPTTPWLLCHSKLRHWGCIKTSWKLSNIPDSQSQENMEPQGSGVAWTLQFLRKRSPGDFESLPGVRPHFPPPSLPHLELEKGMAAEFQRQWGAAVGLMQWGEVSLPSVPCHSLPEPAGCLHSGPGELRGASGDSQPDPAGHGPL